MKTKLLFSILIISICNFQSAFSQTFIDGDVISGHWILAGSPYDVMGSVYIPPDSTLTIDPGVIVNFHPVGSNGITMLVQGQLLAVGAPGDSITFTAYDDTIGFLGIRFADNNIYGSSVTSQLMYCKIQYGRASGSSYLYENGGALAFVHWSNCVVSHCLITNCAASGNGGAIFCDSSSSPVITYNTIAYDTAVNGGGIFCGNSSNPVISYNIISNNDGSGIFCNSNPTISYNTISYNTSIGDELEGPGGGGIYCGYGSDSISSINNNIISHNSSNSIGGGIACLGFIGSVSNNIITYNSPGGVECLGEIAYISNNTISYNNIVGINYGPDDFIPAQLGPISSINNNIIDSNNLGGIYCGGTIASINHNMIVNDGTGISCFFGGLIKSINNNTISHHTAGAIYCTVATISSITSDSISYNSSPNGGGAIYCSGSSILSVSNDIISNDSSTSAGGAIWIGSNSSVDSVYNNIISNNISGSDGGGIWSEGSTISYISNMTMTNNSAVRNGGAFYCSGASPTVLNLTIANNSANQGGAFYCDLSSHPNLYNCILWGDTAGEAGGGNELFQNDAGSVPSFYYCDVQGGDAAFGVPLFYTGTYSNNLDSNPLFVSPSVGAGILYNGMAANWMLQMGSPCINAGDPSYNSYPAFDLAGNPRVIGGRIDIGAYEFQVTTGLSTVSNQSIEFNIYPNPANQLLTIHTTSFSNNAEVMVLVMNVLGQEASPPAPLQRRGEDATIDVSGLEAGVYFVQLKSDSSSVEKMFVKE